MTTPSVFDNLILEPTSIVYPDPDTFNTVYHLAAHTVTAFRDSNGDVDKNLIIGASSNVVVEAVDNVELYIGNELNLFTTTVSTVDGVDVRSNDKIFSVWRSPDTHTTYVSASDNQKLFLTSSNQINLGSMFVDFTKGTQDIIATSKTMGIGFSNSVDMMGNLRVMGNLVGYGSVFTKNGLNMYSTKTNPAAATDAAQIGYSFFINSNTDQLELIKHVRYLNSNQTNQKIAVFGYNTPEHGTTGDRDSYLVFDTLNGVGVANEGAVMPAVTQLDNFITMNGSNVGIHRVDAEYKLDVAGESRFTQTLHAEGGISLTGHMIPTSDLTFDLGSESNRFRDLYMSGNTIYFGNIVVSATAQGISAKTADGQDIPPVQTTDEVNLTDPLIIASSVAVNKAYTTATTACNIAIAASNTTYTANTKLSATSNVAYEANVIAVSASNAATSALSLAIQASNIAYPIATDAASANTNASAALAAASAASNAASNAYFVANSLSAGITSSSNAASNALYTANDASVTASNAYYTAVPLSTNIAAASNTASNALAVAYATSNVAYPASTVAYATSNVAYSANTLSIANSNVLYPASNAAYSASNMAYQANDVAISASLSAQTANGIANTALLTGQSACNIAIAASNEAFTKQASKWTVNSSNIFTNSNVGIGTSTPVTALHVIGGVTASGSADIGGNLTIAGNLVVNGTTTNIDTQTLLIEDNLIVLNKNQAGTPPTILECGFEVERGDQTNYMFIFQESTDTFRIGMSNDTQAVATREDVPWSNAVPYWSTAQQRWLTHSNIVINPVNARLGVGTSNPSYPVHVVGSATTSNVSIFASHDIVAYSDRRVKTDFQRIESALDKVSSINGYTFVRSDAVDAPQKRVAGVIAQEVHTVLPEVVHEDSSTGMLSVAYGNMAALFIEAIKELNAKVDALAIKLA